MPENQTPSQYWADLAQRNSQLLAAAGMENLKRTVANNYFNWFVTDPRRAQFRFALSQWLRRPDLVPLVSTIGDFDSMPHVESSFRRRQVYRLYVSMLWSVMCRHDALGLRFKLEEPTIGNPISVRYGNRLISQDLAHSILECSAITSSLGGGKADRICELGAGYGRLAYVFVAADMVRQYVIVDIEPAISVSHWYLSQVFGPDAVRRVARIEDAPDARVVLLDAGAIETLPDRSFDAVVSISTLPELTPAQVSFYLAQFQRLANEVIFLKQWEDWTNPADGTHLARGDYRLGEEWALKLDQTDPLIVNFFSRAWRRKSDASGGQ